MYNFLSIFIVVIVGKFSLLQPCQNFVYLKKKESGCIDIYHVFHFHEWQVQYYKFVWGVGQLLIVKDCKQCTPIIMKNKTVLHFSKTISRRQNPALNYSLQGSNSVLGKIQGSYNSEYILLYTSIIVIRNSYLACVAQQLNIDP